ncbi:hypothetical protein NKH54_09060 [Mesorhizobium sp. M1004]|uniref:hypothetical protein n=1 Tax=unclassified Mesorhizobium TaxID=325217 RepID=UPI0003CED798|nr:hypothetical protein [Mesorhizobium sp. LNJC391B00]ESY26741.1 hypothetical protein X749_25325 [Mesorhizobium sp. LNJC391B00]
MTLKDDLHAVLDTDRPVFEFTRNLLTLITYWTILLISWFMFVVGPETPGALPKIVFKFFLMVPGIFGVYLISRLVSNAFDLLRQVEKHLANSEWLILRKLPFIVTPIGLVGLGAFTLLLTASLLPPILGVARTLYATH